MRGEVKVFFGAGGKEDLILSFASGGFRWRWHNSFEALN